jgi:hypothetical protein
VAVTGGGLLVGVGVVVAGAGLLVRVGVVIDSAGVVPGALPWHDARILTAVTSEMTIISIVTNRRILFDALLAITTDDEILLSQPLLKVEYISKNRLSSNVFTSYLVTESGTVWL